MNPVPYQLDYGSGCILATGPFSLTGQLLGCPGARRDDITGTILLPVNRDAFLMAEAIAAPETTDLYNAARRKVLRPTREQLAAVERRFHETSGGEVPSLLIHQWEFLAFALHRNQAFNASEQGLGKTRMALALLRLWDCRRVIVVMPKSLATQWEAELPAIWPDHLDRPRFVNVTDGTKEQRAGLLRVVNLSNKPHQIIAVNYEMLDTLRGELLKVKPDAIVLDEAWKCKNHKAQMTKAAIKLADAMWAKHPGKTLALAGTPLGKDVGELWSQLRFLHRDHAPETYHQFIRRYANLEPVQIPGRTIFKPVGVADPVALMARLSPVWFRATKRTCLNLPPKEQQVVSLRLPPATRRLYDDVNRRGMAALGDELSLAGRAVTDLRLHQIAGGHTPTMTGDEETWQAMPLDGCPKREWLREWAQETLLPHPQTRAIIWCRFNAEVYQLAEEMHHILGPRVQPVTGKTPQDRLDDIKASFNSRDPEGVQVIVAQVKRLAFGHNLQAADWMIYHSLSWFSIEHWQSEDRAHRIGRADGVRYRYLLAERTIDEEVWATLGRNEDFASRVTPGTATPTTGRT